jgi:ATP-dependent DNA helicase RecG
LVKYKPAHEVAERRHFSGREGFMASFRGRSAVDNELEEALRILEEGHAPRDIETAHVDFKEESGRRDEQGRVLDGIPRNEDAAGYLWGELACMANTPGGGALIVGVANDGRRIGTALDPDWLRHRIYELSQRRLTADVYAHRLDDDTRLLVCRVLQAVEPYRVNGRIKWRVHDNCVEVDAATWHSRISTYRFDWSAEPSDRTVTDVSPNAVAVARSFLRGSDDSRDGWADLSDIQLLRRIPNVLTTGDRFTNGGRLLFTDIDPALDYIHREVAGGDSTARVRAGGPLLVQLQEVFNFLRARGRTVHISSETNPTIGQVQSLPLRSAREAIVNGVVHREWNDPSPTLVEHTGDNLRVTSPGGLVGTVTPLNIITHPSTPRHRALAETTSKLGLTEREGIGVDRMYVDVLQLGLPAPIIEELEGPRVRVLLRGGPPNTAWLRLRRDLPALETGDLNVLLALRLLANRGWASMKTLAGYIQDHAEIAANVLEDLTQARTSQNECVVIAVEGQPSRRERAYRLSDMAADRLSYLTVAYLSPEVREELVESYVRHFGRISTTEASSLGNVARAIMGDVLKDLEAEEILIPSRANRAGRGFHYLLSEDA